MAASSCYGDKEEKIQKMGWGQQAGKLSIALWMFLELGRK
jgi:hypothetical protein